MKTMVHFFSWDTDGGMDTTVSFDIKDIEREVRDTVRRRDPGLYATMAGLEFDSAEWCEAWSVWKEQIAQTAQCYYNYGTQEITLPVPKVVAVVRDGTVVDVCCDRPVAARVVDADTQGCEVERLVTYDSPDGHSFCGVVDQVDVIEHAGLVEFVHQHTNVC